MIESALRSYGLGCHGVELFGQRESCCPFFGHRLALAGCRINQHVALAMMILLAMKMLPLIQLPMFSHGLELRIQFYSSGARDPIARPTAREYNRAAGGLWLPVNSTGRVTYADRERKASGEGT